MTSTQGNEIPTQATSGQTTDTTEDHTKVELPQSYMRHGAPIVSPAEALKNPYAADINRLNSFLMTRFPEQMNRTNRQRAESPVDAAIRLLSGATTSGTGITRCGTEYCNLPKNHDGDHGFVNYQPR